MGKLSHKQQRFISEYLVDLSATGAATRAGYAAGSAHVTGFRLLKNAKVLEAITAAQQKIHKKLEITVEEVLEFWADTMRDMTIDRATRIAASDKLGKALAMYTSKVHVTGTLTLEDLLLAADKQRAQLPATH